MISSYLYTFNDILTKIIFMQGIQEHPKKLSGILVYPAPKKGRGVCN